MVCWGGQSLDGGMNELVFADEEGRVKSLMLDGDNTSKCNVIRLSRSL